MAVEQLYLNLAYRHTEDLVDPPGGLARMAKEMIQTSVRQQSDVSAAMAVRLNKVTADPGSGRSRHSGDTHIPPNGGGRFRIPGFDE
ncbi:MAG: hypothetical protein IPM88_02070 [Nitrospira sp.]|nr:hypothetical protein [Nitrospira sp.]